MDTEKLPITVILRADDKISGTNSNFVVNLPLTLPSSSRFYSVQLLSANLPTPDSTTRVITPSSHYITGGIEIRCDLGGRTHVFDTTASNYAVVGFLANEPNTNSFQGLFQTLPLLGQTPTHIFSNVKHQIGVQLMDDDGDFLQTTLIASPYTKSEPEPIVLVFEFTPLDV